MLRETGIYFFFKDVSIFLPARGELKNFITRLFIKEGKKLKSLNYVFCTDREILKINRAYLDHDFYTDTISFDLSENKNEIIGEIYISVDRVKKNAASFETTIKNELLRVMFHGALHLCGYRDDSEDEKKAIRKKEEQYMLLYIK